MNKRILFIRSAKHASAYYRMFQASMLMEEMGYYVRRTDCIHDRGLDWSIIEQDYDVVVVQFGFTDKLIGLVNKFKEKGSFTVLETDDNHHNLQPYNPAFIQLHPKWILYSFIEHKTQDSVDYRYVTSDKKINYSLDNFKKLASKVDLLQVSTPELADAYNNLNENIVILENCIDNKLYDSVKKEEHDGVVVGWFGTPTHKMDLRYVIGAIPDDVRFITAGDSTIKDKYFKDMDNVTSTGYYDLMELPKIISQMDFGLVPLEDNIFNSCKSDLKGLEFAAMSLPVIASPIAPYKRFIRHMENGILLKNNNGKEWVKAIRRLADDKDLRVRLGKEAKKDAVKRDIENNIGKWIKAYRLD